jgi:hypothetical protein
MFQILCITTGQHIKLPAKLAWNATQKMPSNIREGIETNTSVLASSYWSNHSAWDYLVFKNEEAAKWFISHRLVYNPRRKDIRKVEFMKQLFEFNDIPGWETVNLEFIVDSV